MGKELLGSLELNRVYQMDCLEGMKLIPDKSIDMILCDLPYGTTACKWDTIIPFEPLWEQYERIIKDKGAIVLTASQPFTSALVMSNPKLFRYEWIWEKKRPTGFVNAKKQPLRSHESVLVFSKKPTQYFPQGLIECNKVVTRNSAEIYGIKEKQTNIQEFTNYPRTVQRFSNPNKNSFHPTQKPVALFEYLIKTYTNEGEIVLDNCLGSGTSAVAATLNNRKWIGFETEPKYIEIINKRLDEIQLEDDLNDY